MIRRLIRGAFDWIARVAHHPREELTHWQATARFWYDLARVGGRQLQEDRALQMAAALAFHTMFALMPLAVVSTALFKGMQGDGRLRSLIHQLVESAGLDRVRVMPTEGHVGSEGVSLGMWLEDTIRKLGDINLEAVGLLGLVGIVYAAVAMLVTVEASFNAIYSVPQGRSWLRRLVSYWTVLTAGPLGIALLFFIDGHVGQWIASVEASNWLIRLLGVAWSIGVITVMLLGTFVLLPNTHVQWRSAIGGAFVSATLLYMGKTGLAIYINNAFSFGQIYGSLGLVPVLMLWTYAMWICILFGVEVAAIVQRLGGSHEVAEIERSRVRSPLLDASAVLVLMEVIAEGFRDGKSTTLSSLVDETGLPEPSAREILEKLVGDNFLHRIAGGGVAYTLARPPEAISAESLIAFGQSMTHGRHARRVSKAVEAMLRSQREFAGSTSLAGLSQLQAG